MKAIFTFCLWLSAVTASFSQADTITYLNKDFEAVTQSEALYYRIVRVVDASTGRGYRKDFHITGEKLEEANYSKTDSVRDGWSFVWFKSGQLRGRYFYVNGRAEGKTETWFEDGNLKWDLSYKNGKLQDTIRTYHPNRQLKRLDVFANGELVQGQCFDEKGEKVAHHPFEAMPVFPGGQKAMFKYLADKMKIPKDMRKARQNGRVVLSFVVGPDGKVDRIQVVKTTHQSLAETATKVIGAMPAWTPAVQDGQKVSVKYTVPYVVKIN